MTLPVRSEFGPSSPADAPEIAALCQRALAVTPGSPMFSAEHMQWKYWQSWPLWPGSRSFVLRRGGRIVAHGAVMPLLFERGGRKHTLFYLFDWASEPLAVGSGVALFKRIAALADGMLLVGGSAMTRKMIRPLGFRPVGDVTSHAAPAARPHAAVDAVDRDHAVRRLEPVDDAVLQRPESTDDRVLFQRPASALRELLGCPVAAMEYYGVSRHGVPIGCFLLSFTPAQGMIVDAWSISSDLEEWTRLLRLAHRQVSACRDVDEVVCMASDPLERQALAQAGFATCGSDPLFVLASTDLVPDHARVRFQMLDSDLAFLHHGVPRRWLSHTTSPRTPS